MVWLISNTPTMAANTTHTTTFHRLCLLLFLLSAFSSISFFIFNRGSCPCYVPNQIQPATELLAYPDAWNQLSFSSNPPAKLLKIAVFVKKWPHASQAGGLERHALTLHLGLAKRGHELHIFTASHQNSTFPKYSFPNLHFHLSNATPGGFLDQSSIWEQFKSQNATGTSFDVLHTESVGLMHTRAKNFTNVVISWHGIAYETIHSDIIQELARTPDERRSQALSQRVMQVVKEVGFFPRYAHHVATSNHAGDILKRIYMIPEDRVHIILNGVDEDLFRPDPAKGEGFKREFGIPRCKSLILGMAGRLVRDKGHPVMFEALKQILQEDKGFKEDVMVVIAGDGPWRERYKELGQNVLVLGPLDRGQLAGLYNAIDVFVNPTLRAQGLDHTLLEAMLSGKPLLATRLASITGTVIVGDEMGFTFAPTVESLKDALLAIWRDGKEKLEMKGRVARERGLKLFTATKMVGAYERLFLCISGKGRGDNNSTGSGEDGDYCRY